MGVSGFAIFFTKFAGPLSAAKFERNLRGLDISSNFSLHFGARGALPLGPATYRSTAAAAAATTAGPLPTLLLLLPFMTLAAGIRVSSCVNAECPDMCCRMCPHVVHLSRNFSLHLCARKLLHNVISQKISRNLQRGFTKLLKEICGGSARNLRPRQCPTPLYGREPSLALRGIMK